MLSRCLCNKVCVLVRNLFHQRHYYATPFSVEDTIKIAQFEILKLLEKNRLWLSVEVEWEEGAECVAHVDISDECFEIYFGGCDDDGEDCNNWGDLKIVNPVEKVVAF